MKHFLRLTDYTKADIYEIFHITDEILEGHYQNLLQGKSVVLFFPESSIRTRVTFEKGIALLGGQPILFPSSALDKKEDLQDVIGYLNNWANLLVVRHRDMAALEKIAASAFIPVINALTDEYHPCQILADLLTIREYSGRTDGSIRMAFYGDARSNIANSLILAARLTGMELVLCSPAEEQPDRALYAGCSNVSWEADPMKAAAGVDYFYTDVWVSMGFEEERERRMKLFAPYQVNEKLFSVAKPDAKFLHCLPAHRGEEVSAGVMDDPKRSIVFDEAENRLHVQKAVMAMLMK